MVKRLTFVIIAIFSILPAGSTNSLISPSADVTAVGPFKVLLNQ